MNKQKGFVQGALLIGIALLAIVIGAFAMASNNNTSDISKEKAKTNAAVAVKKFADTYERYQIDAAQTDIGTAEANLVSNLNLALPTGFTGSKFDNKKSAEGETVLSSVVGDAVTCAQINRVLGLSVDTSDSNAIGAGNDADEACVDIGGNTYNYYRDFRGHARFAALN